jgi:hypothetical protein
MKTILFISACCFALHCDSDDATSGDTGTSTGDTSSDDAINEVQNMTDSILTDQNQQTEQEADTELNTESPEEGTAESSASVTWSNTVSALFVTYCVDCHSTSPKDYTDYSEVINWEDKIRCGVAPTTQSDCGSWPPANQFPVGPGPFPTIDERQLIVDWIDAGMPQ